MQPLINPFLGGLTSINGAISAEFAHTVYRLGHSMLPEVVARIERQRRRDTERHPAVQRLPEPAELQRRRRWGTLTADKAAGSLVRGLSREIGNELDEFITDSVRNTLVGLPLDLAAINMARGRSEGIPSLNNARRQLFTATRDAALEALRSLVRVRLEPEAPGVAGQLHRGLRHRSEHHHGDDDGRQARGGDDAGCGATGRSCSSRRPPAVSTTWTSGSAASPSARRSSAACSARRSTTSSRSSSRTCRTATGSTTCSAPTA